MRLGADLKDLVQDGHVRDQRFMVFIEINSLESNKNLPVSRIGLG